uniref:Uncharacterized protein n=1 Tax=Anguilla anguilla TaxID=7936 RepID=A0A0E9X026_ANGAN
MCLIFIFLYGYLLHSVVYNTVVCINTIIYFSMKNNLDGKRIQSWTKTSGILRYVLKRELC